MQKLTDMDRRGVWAFTPATFSALLGEPEPNYLKLRMKRLADEGVLTRAARGVYVNPLARSAPNDVRAGLIRFLRPRQVSYISLGQAVRGRRDFAGHHGVDVHDNRVARAFRHAVGRDRVYPHGPLRHGWHRCASAR